MKKNISGLIILVILLISLSVTAQVPKGMGKSDPDAKKILDAVSAKFKGFKAIQAKFTLKVENSLNKVIGNKTGTVYMKGTKFRISADGQETFCDGYNVWNLDKSAKEVTINKVDASNNAITPQKLFTNFYDKDFLYKLNNDAGGTQEIELTPIDKSKPFHKVLLFINKTAQIITSGKVFEKTGNRITYSLSGMNGNAIVTDATFAYDSKKYPGIEVVDLR